MTWIDKSTWEDASQVEGSLISKQKSKHTLKDKSANTLEDKRVLTLKDKEDEHLKPKGEYDC